LIFEVRAIEDGCEIDLQLLRGAELEAIYFLLRDCRSNLQQEGFSGLSLNGLLL